MKDKKFILILILTFTLLLIGCSNNSNDILKVNTKIDDTRFIPVGDTYKIKHTKYEVYHDTESDIIYLVNLQSYSADLQPLLNKEGKTITLEEYIETR